MNSMPEGEAAHILSKYGLAKKQDLESTSPNGVAERSELAIPIRSGLMLFVQCRFVFQEVRCSIHLSGGSSAGPGLHSVSVDFIRQIGSCELQRRRRGCHRSGLM